ncbi:MAG: hypothetical protein AAB407_01565 [Patescibacteria group bacterium]
MRSIIRFIQNLQEQSESVRRRWLVILSGGTMLVVLLVWVGYLKAIIPSTEVPTVEAESEKMGFTESFKAGLVIVGEGTRGVLKQGGKIAESAKNQISEDRTIIIETPQKNFILETLEVIPPTQLP